MFLKNQGKNCRCSDRCGRYGRALYCQTDSKSRRIYLPNVRYIENAKIVYQKNEEEIIYADKITNSLNASLLDLIYMKTGMRFLLNDEKMNWLQPDNLQDTVNLISLLGDMKVPENDSEYLDNIEKFTEYFEKEWIPQNCELVNYKRGTEFN